MPNLIVINCQRLAKYLELLLTIKLPPFGPSALSQMNEFGHSGWHTLCIQCALNQTKIG